MSQSQIQNHLLELELGLVLRELEVPGQELEARLLKHSHRKRMAGFEKRQVKLGCVRLLRSQWRA